jgi:hypothetical protein
VAIEIPTELIPVFQFYGIPWPDIDEDAFNELPKPLRTFGSDVSALGGEVSATLRELADGNSSQTLHAIADHFAMIRRDFLDKVSTLCDDLAGTPCRVAYDAIVTLKLAAIGAVAYQVTETVADLASEAATVGADTPLVVAQWIAVRETVEELLRAALEQIPSLLVQYATPLIQDWTNQLIGGFVNSIEHVVEGSVDPFVANLLFADLESLESAATVVAGKLHLTPEDLERSITSIAGSSVSAVAAGQQLEHAAKQLFAQPAPGAGSSDSSPALRVLVGVVVTQVVQELSKAADQLIHHIIDDVVHLLQSYRQALENLDQQASTQASREHAAPGPALVVASTVGVAAAVATGIVATSGAAGGEGEGTVQVGEASLVSETTSVEAGPDGPSVAAQDASAQDTVADLSPPAPEKLDTDGSPVADTETVGTLERKASPAQPRVLQAESEPKPAASLSPHRDPDGDRAHVGDGTPVRPPKDEPELHVRTRDRDEPRLEDVTHPEPAVHAVHTAAPAKRTGTDAGTDPTDRRERGDG